MVQHVTVVFIVVLIGYSLLSRTNPYRHRLLTTANYVVLYESAIAGGAVFVLAWLVINSGKLAVFDCLSMATAMRSVCAIDQVYPLPQLDVLGVSIVLVVVLVYGGNRAYPIEKIGEASARGSGLIGRTLIDALDGDYLIQITTVRNKVYVGWIMRGPGVSSEGLIKDIAIAPLYAGYRAEQTHLVELNADYSAYVKNVVDSHPNSSRLDADEIRSELSVIVPIGEIALIKRHMGLAVESSFRAPRGVAIPNVSVGSGEPKSI